MTEPSQEIHAIPLEQISPSPHQPRRELRDIEELAESMRAVGQLTPAKVRTVPFAGGNTYELVFGHRRLAAARLAGLATLDCVVVELSDEAVRREALVENAQRESPHPMDEAEAIEVLADEGATIDAIAAELGMTRAYVARRRRLLGLTAKSREAYRSGELTTENALTLARIADPKVQGEALDALAHLSRWDTAEGVLRRTLPTVGVAFPADREGLADRVACTACPRRSGAQATLFADALELEDLCTDPACHKAKTRAFVRAEKARAKAEGLDVLSKKASEEHFSFDGSRVQSQKYFDADAPLQEHYWLDTRKRRSAAAWAEAQGLDLPQVLAQRPAGGVCRLMERKVFEKAWKKAHPEGERSTEADDWVAQRRREAKEREAQAKAERRAVRATRDAILEEVAGLSWHALEEDRQDALLRAILVGVLRRCSAATAKLLIAHREDIQEAVAAEKHARADAVLAGQVGEMDRSELLYWLARLAVLQVYETSWGEKIPDEAELFAAVFEVDTKAVAKSARRAKPKRKGTTKKKRRQKAAAKEVRA